MLFLIILIIAVLLTYLIIVFASKTKFLLRQEDLIGVQKFHTQLVARIGGIPVFISFFFGIFLYLERDTALLLLLVSIPVFFGGLIEDILSRVSPSSRMVTTLISVAAAFIFLDIRISFLGFAVIDSVLSNYIIISLIFTLFIVGGLINAINIIDGYNGLALGYSILVLLAMAYVANTLGDDLVLQLSLMLMSSLFGLFLFNFPFGKIFMGDGGAYFIGFMLSVIGLMLGIRNDEVSHWFILLLFIYPLYETAFSIYRKRIVRGVPISQPDGYHLHMLIYKRVVKCKTFKNNKIMCNSMTSPFLWALSLVGIIPAVVWYNDQTMLIILAFIFMATYTIIYRRIVHFKFKFRK